MSHLCQVCDNKMFTDSNTNHGQRKKKPVEEQTGKAIECGTKCSSGWVVDCPGIGISCWDRDRVWVWVGIEGEWRHGLG